MFTITSRNNALDAGFEEVDDERVDVGFLTCVAHEQMVRRYVAALSREPGAVDDLAQEVFVRAIERIDRLRSPGDAGGFLRGIARHVVQEHFRARRRDRQYDELTTAAMADQGDGAAARCHERAMQQWLHGAIAALPVVSRRMLEMRYHDGLSASEIARRLDITHVAVRVSLLRIRDRLRKAVDQAAQDSTHF